MLTSLLKTRGYDLTFTLMEIGARIIERHGEPFYRLLETFPTSRILAFEVDPEECSRLNVNGSTGVIFFPYAIGKTEEERSLYLTEHPMCTSLYKPNEPYLGLFHNLEAAKLKETSTVKTISLDHFAQINDIGPIDFIKIDIQGAELDAFQGGRKTLMDVLVIISEVEFVPLYENQPLFGDVAAFLEKQRLIFHKFLGLAGRAMKPIIVNNNENFPVQHLWSDAVFIQDLLKIDDLESSQMLKMASILDLYNSPDVAWFILNRFDIRNGSTLANDYVNLHANQGTTNRS